MTSTGRRVVGGLADGLLELGRLVLPVDCAGCGEPDMPWCDRCARSLGEPWRCEHLAGRLDTLAGAPPPPVWATSRYVGEVRRAVVRWKDRGRLDLTTPFAAALTTAATHLAPQLGPGGADVLVVPVPSSPAARRSRGTDPVAALAEAVATGLRVAGVRAVVVRALRRRAGGRDQVGLGARDRRANLRGAVVPVRRAARVRDAAWHAGARPAVVLVDDVLTTGATFAACAAVLGASGLPVTAGLVLASTPPPGADRPVRVPPRPVPDPPVRRVADPAGNGLAW